jgi:hypothetical protein
MVTTYRLLLFASVLSLAGALSAQTPASPRDGSHDFDFNIGSWHTHIRRVLDPFSPSSAFIVLEGTVTVHKVWNGRAQLEEIEADGPKGHWEGMTLFLYNPETHEWSQTFANNTMGAPDVPLIGSFNDGRGELYSQDTFHNRSILVRGTWSDITPDAHRYTESYSDDAGATWHDAFIAELTRQAPATATLAPPFAADANDPAHAFDWDLGRWRIEIARLAHPLTGSKTWTQMEGTTVNSPFWNGAREHRRSRSRWPHRPSRTPGVASLQSRHARLDYQFCHQRCRKSESAHWSPHHRIVQRRTRRIHRSRALQRPHYSSPLSNLARGR